MPDAQVTVIDGQTPEVVISKGSQAISADVGVAVIDSDVAQVIVAVPGVQGAAGTAVVSSVAGKTGAVTLTRDDVGLGNVPNTDATNASNISSGTLDAARLPSAGVGAGTYGSVSQSAVLTVDATGRVTAASNASIAPDWSSVTNKPSFAASATTDTTNAANISSGTLSSNRLPSIGNITNAGAIGTTANLPVITTTSGVLTTGSFGTTANTFCQGNDSRLSDTRTPTDSSVTDAKVASNAAIAGSKIQAATTTNAGAVQLTDSTSSTSTTTAATPNSVKSAYDLANAAMPKSGGAFTGDVTLNAQSDLRFADSDSSNWVALQSPATVPSNVTWTLPSADGSSGQVLSTNGSGTLSWVTAGGGGGLAQFVETENTSAPNATTPVDAFVATDASYTNLDVALVAKGTGATLAQVPDGAATAGNKRGQYATDLQKSRTVNTEVASGNYSSITGGTRNTASAESSFVGAGAFNKATGTRSSVLGGSSNTASGQDSFVGGGFSNNSNSNYSFVGGGDSNEAKTNTHATCAGGKNNDATGQYSFVGGGDSNVASSFTSVVAGGYTNTVSNQFSGILGGESNVVTASDASVVGGYGNTATGDFSFVSGGARGTTRGINGYHVFPACYVPVSSTQGSTQSGLLLLGRQTTDATVTTLASTTSVASTTNQVILPNNSAYSFSGEVIAGVTGGGDTARWTISGAIKRGANAASTAMVGTPTVTMTHNDSGAASWVVAVTADTTNGGIKVAVTGAASTTIRWVCKIETTEMSY